MIQINDTQSNSIKIKISACMATYNGINYLPEQMSSILDELGEEDELIIVDDASTDGTVEYIKGYKDSRIKLYVNEKNIGHVQSFAKTLNFAQGYFIFFADQDDVWIKNRISIMCKELEKGVLLISTNTGFMDKHGAKIGNLNSGVLANNSNRYINNIFNIFMGRAYYFGCAMGFRREIIDIILPIPKYVESHDLFIAMAANCVKSNIHLEMNSLDRRIHGGNVSVVKRAVIKKIKSRFIFGISLVNIMSRIISKKFT